LLEFVHRSLKERETQPSFKTSFLFVSTSEVAEAVLSYFDKVREAGDEDYVQEMRHKISNLAEKYYKGLQEELPDPVTSEIERNLRLLRSISSKNLMLIVTAHQPNLFPFSGVMRKIVLANHLSKLVAKLKKAQGSNDFEVLCLFAVADHDFVHNKWIRSAELPAPLRRDGVLRLNLQFREKSDLMLPSNRIPKPSKELLERWRSEIFEWIQENGSLATKYLRSIEPESKTDVSSQALQSFRDFWELVETAHNYSANLSEFSSFLLFLVSSKIWRIPMLFMNLSNFFPLLRREYLWFLENSEGFRSAILESEERLKACEVDSGLPNDLAELSPLWLRCKCGSKYRLSFSERDLSGKCLRCQSEIFLSLGEARELIEHSPELFEPRSISMPISLSRATHMSCYIGGIGSLGYLIHARTASIAMRVSFPPTPFWFVPDRFIGVEQLAAMHEIKRIAQTYKLVSAETDLRHLESNAESLGSQLRAKIETGEEKKTPVTQRDQQLLQRISKISHANPCMIGYAVDIGLDQLVAQWNKFLERVGNLHSEVPLESFCSLTLGTPVHSQLPL
jgi:hypothetical protein